MLHTPKAAFGLAIFLLGTITGVQAQFTFDHSNFQKGRGFVTDVTGRKPDPSGYDRIIDGSPWWRDFFIPADLSDGQGRVYQNVPVKIDLLADKVFYQDNTGAIMELITPVKYLHAYPVGSNDTFKLVRADYFTLPPEGRITGWLQMRIMGEAILLQELDKVMNESKPYNSAVTEYSVSNQFSWIVVLEASLYKINKPKELQELLAARKPALAGYSFRQKGNDAQIQELVLAFNRM